MVDSIFPGMLLKPRSRTDVVVALVGGIGALATLDSFTRVSRFLLGVRQVPPVVARVRHYVPVATLAALIVTRLAVPGEIAPCLVAAVYARAVGLRLGKLWANLLVSMAVFRSLLTVGVCAKLIPMIRALAGGNVPCTGRRSGIAALERTSSFVIMSKGGR